MDTSFSRVSAKRKISSMSISYQSGRNSDKAEGAERRKKREALRIDCGVQELNRDCADTS